MNSAQTVNRPFIKRELIWPCGSQYSNSNYSTRPSWSYFYKAWLVYGSNNRKEGAAHKTAEKAVYLFFGNNSV